MNAKMESITKKSNAFLEVLDIMRLFFYLPEDSEIIFGVTKNHIFTKHTIIIQKPMLKKPSILVKSLTFIMLLLSDAFSGLAQDRTVSGLVKDGNGVPVVGAAVTVVGANGSGVVVDNDGRFSLRIPSGAKLRISCIGYETQEILPGNLSEIIITLLEDSLFLEETVVIGYGVQKKSDITGAIATINEADLANRSSSNAMQAMQGKAAGVQVLNSSGAPGAGSEIRVRGYSSNASTGLGPLLIVDGLQVDNIQYLEPGLIESMEILKDAASAAIYGAQAGNGVVLITTKNGKASKGKGSVFYNYQGSVNTLGRHAKVMNANQYLGWGTEAGLIYPELLTAAGYDGKTDTNWADAVYGTGYTNRHTIGVQGSNDRGSFYVSLSNLKDDGMVRGDKDVYSRLTAQINAEYKIKDWLTVGTNNSIEKWSTKSVGEQSEFSGSVILGTMIMDPLTPVYYENDANMSPDLKQALQDGKNLYKNENGKYYAVSRLQESDAGNPFILRDSKNVQYDGLNVRGGLYANVTLLKGLTFTSRIGYRIGQSYYTNYVEPFYASPRVSSTSYSLTSTASLDYYYQWENYANYDFSIGKNHFTAMAGMSYIENNMRGVSGTVSGADPLAGYAENFRYLDFANASANKTLSALPTLATSISYFGRLAWNYDNRYSLQTNFRADAFDSSKLPSDSRWGYFPSFSAGWTVSNEEFMEPVKGMLDFLKLRASWGKNGNVSVLSGYPYSTSISYNTQVYQWAVADNTVSYGSKPSGLANPNLTWETSTQYDLGLDARFFADRLSFTADYYKKTTDGLLVTVIPVLEVGIGSSVINAGTVDNSGFEFELGWKDHIGDLSYSVSANLSTLKNNVSYLESSISRLSGTGLEGTQLTTCFEQGFPVWYMRGYVYEGADPSDGSPVYKDLNEDRFINTDDMTNVGCGIPDVQYGVTLNLEYKNFDLTVFGTGVAGNEIYAAFFRVGRPLVNNLSCFYEDRWTSATPTGYYAAPSKIYNDRVFWSSTADVFDGSYFKIKQLQLGYSFPSKLLNRVRIQGLRLFASLDDFFTFTSYPGMDPETISTAAASSIGIDKGNFPTAKKIVFGVNVSF